MYTPILKIKQAEIDAIAQLDITTRNITRPLFEFVMPYSEQMSIEESQQKFLNDLPEKLKGVQNAQGDKECLFDLRLVDKKIQAEVLEKIIEHRYNDSLFFPVINAIPIFAIDHFTETHQTILNNYKNKMCIRVTKADIQHRNFFEYIQQFIGKHNLKPYNIEIILDFGYVETDELNEKTYELIKKIFRFYPWNSITFAVGAFPKDLSHLTSNEEHYIERYDYALWEKIREQFKGVHFADYTIQHPIQFQLGAYAPSSSNRYALGKQWLIQRGEQPKKGEGRAQYIAHAKLLVGKNEYYGADHCEGCGYIMEKSKESLNSKTIHTGNPKTWLQAGICHHITLTARQIANHS